MPQQTLDERFQNGPPTRSESKRNSWLNAEERRPHGRVRVATGPAREVRRRREDERRDAPCRPALKDVERSDAQATAIVLRCHFFSSLPQVPTPCFQRRRIPSLPARSTED